MQLANSIDSARRVGSGWRRPPERHLRALDVHHARHQLDEYLQSRSRNFRKAHKQAWNRAHRANSVEVLRAGSDIALDDAMERLVRLNRGRWGSDGVASRTKHFRAFHEVLAPKLLAKDRLSLLLLQFDGKDAAVRYDFVYANRLWVFQGGWAPELGNESPGRVLTAYSIQWCIENGISEYDFLAGAADYKTTWATGSRRLLELELKHPRSVRARVFGTLRTAKRLVNDRA